MTNQSTNPHERNQPVDGVVGEEQHEAKESKAI